MTSPNNNPNRSWTEMVAASRNESPAPVDVCRAVRAELESLACSGETSKQSWAEMVSASRNEFPASVDVRYAVRAELESLVRRGQVREDNQADWTRDILRLFNPGFVKLGLAAAFVCMLVLAGTTSVLESDLESDYADPLVTMNTVESDAESEWSDWL